MIGKRWQMQTLSILIVLVLLALIAGSVAAEDPGFQPQQATIAGMVRGIDEDDEGHPRRVCIQDDNLPSPVLVADDDKGRELLTLVGSQVEASGTLEHTEEAEAEGYDFMIRIDSYRVLD
jgi:hypothetical protein